MWIAHYLPFFFPLSARGPTRRRNSTGLAELWGGWPIEQALIKVEAAVMNILEIVRVDQRAGEQFYQAPPGAAPTSPSLAERTINNYSNGDNATKSTVRSAE